ncbi:hypothetical protein QTP86_008954 [Hemibagrus guttatus]|nr:hypothetical protein QTP86_008954 [Hemibagrus guttatus]
MERDRRRETDGDGERQEERDSCRWRETGGERQMEMERDRRRETDGWRETGGERQMEMERDRRRETDGDGERERERERDELSTDLHSFYFSMSPFFFTFCSWLWFSCSPRVELPKVLLQSSSAKFYCRKAHLPPPNQTTFYRGTIESILSSCITTWFGNCTVSDRKTLQRIVRTAEKIIGVSLPSIMDLYTTRCICKANSIVDDPTHPLHPPTVWKEPRLVPNVS